MREFSVRDVSVKGVFHLRKTYKMNLSNFAAKPLLANIQKFQSTLKDTEFGIFQAQGSEDAEESPAKDQVPKLFEKKQQFLWSFPNLPLQSQQVPAVKTAVFFCLGKRADDLIDRTDAA